MASIGPKLKQSMNFTHERTRALHITSKDLQSFVRIRDAEILATVWISYIQDAAYSINLYWTPSVELKDFLCPLPADHEDFGTEVSFVAIASRLPARGQRVCPRSLRPLIPSISGTSEPQYTSISPD